MIPEPVDSIFLQLSQDIYNQIIEEAALWADVETGGLLFGNIREGELGLEIQVEKVYIPPDELVTRKSTYFEIDSSYARQLLEEESSLYLGNWHKHLGYGGPSHGDHGEITDFFSLNPHRSLILALIVDFLPDRDPILIAEVYRRKQNDLVNNGYEILHITENNILIDPIEKISLQSLSQIKGIHPHQLKGIKKTLIAVFKNSFTMSDIQEFAGASPGERIISFPFQFSIDTEDQVKFLTLSILISFPSDFPEGQIYIDISSLDMSRNFTVEKHPANLLADPELIEPFLCSLKSSLEVEIPAFLTVPLWKIMEGLK